MAFSAPTVRQVTRVFTARAPETRHGVATRRPFPTEDLKAVDPFLLLEQLGPTELEHGNVGGDLERRWEGVEAITCVVRGELEHEDSTGFRTVLRPGDVQWLTTGSGLVCSQLPARQMREQGGALHVIQLRVDLPPGLKGIAPRYQTFGRAA